MPLNESDTRAKLIDPALHDRGWTENLIRREVVDTRTPEDLIEIIEQKGKEIQEALDLLRKKCDQCGTTLQTVLYGMPDAEDAYSGKYHIMGCTIEDDSPSEKWFCPECEIFVA